MLMQSLLSQGLKCSTCIQMLSPFYLLLNKLWVEHRASECWLLCGRCHISHICEVLLSISGADHIHHMCKMHFESCAISHDYQSKRYENIIIFVFSRLYPMVNCFAKLLNHSLDIQIHKNMLKLYLIPQYGIIGFICNRTLISIRDVHVALIDRPAKSIYADGLTKWSNPIVTAW